MIRRPQKTRDHNKQRLSVCTLYPVPCTWYMIPDMYTAAVLIQSKVSIEPPQHRPSARAASTRAALSTPSERRDRTQMPIVLGESRESCRLSNTQLYSNKPQWYIQEYITSCPSRARPSPTTSPDDRWLTSTVLPSATP